jgi:Domain of unknown function (DUF4333)
MTDPPSAAPPRRSRTGLVLALAGVLVAAAVAVVLVALLSTEVLDRAAVERDVARQFQQREGVAVDLSCDHEMTVERGASYECTGTTAQGEEVRLRITVTDERTAAYTWSER